jgi:exodeoxyribonuclease-3
MGESTKEAARRARREAALAERPVMTPSAPAPDRVRVATWNLNSLRVRLPALLRLLDRTRPDVVCLQETRGARPSDDARAGLAELGYEIEHVGTGGHNGVAIASRHPIRDVEASGGFGIEVLDREPRLVAATVDLPTPIRSTPARFVSVYVPHGRAVDHWHFVYKLDFLAALTERVAAWEATGHVIVAGDVNIAATNSDVFHPDAFVGATHVTPAERDALTRLLDVGLVDVDVERWGARARRFTWWKPGFGYSRNLGMRIDVIAVDRALATHLDTTWIDHLERGAERPSDHAALLADFHPEGW